MKLHTCLLASVTGAVLLAVSGAAAGAPAEDLGALLSKIDKVSSTATQARYSREVQKSVNAAAVKDMAQTCASKHAGARVQTFSLLGTMRIDGLLKDPIALPDNAFTNCIAANIGSTHFPLPPGNARGWPVAMQFDASNGRVLYMAGDKQPAMPLYQSSTMSTMKWVYTPIPVIPANHVKSCVVSVWVTAGVHGRVETADTGDTNCPSSLNNAAVAAARQWLKLGKNGAPSDESLDVRISFNIGKTSMKVTL